MRVARGLPGISIFVQGDEEPVSAAVAHFPLPDKVRAAWSLGFQAGRIEVDARNFARNLLASTIPIDDDCGSLEIDAGNLPHDKRLPMPIFEGHNDRAVIVGRGPC